MKKDKQKKKEKKKSPPLFPRFTPFMGKRKGLLTLSLVLSGLSAALHVVPFFLIWLIVRELLTHTGNLLLSGIGRCVVGICRRIRGASALLHRVDMLALGSVSSGSRHAKNRDETYHQYASRFFRSTFIR